MSEKSTLQLEPSTLWSQLKARTQSALAQGALQSLPTDRTWIEDRGIRFLTRSLFNLQRKEKARKQQTGNPFLPYEEALFVTNISETHLCLLNKYNVVDRHLLMITRAFESQENWLNINDFEAMWACLAGVEGLAFYNGGAIAGASQPHKHLQLIPLVSEETVYSLPIAPAIAQIQWDTEIATIPVFNFPHAIAKFDFSWQDSLTEAATATLALYRRLLHHLGIEIQGENATQAYNLLATRQWLLIVPRSRADYAGIPVNSLGFAGALLVKSSQQLAYLKALGPLNLLEKVAVNNKLCN